MTKDGATGGVLPGGDPEHSELAVLLACFAGRKTAGRQRRPLTSKLRSDGDALLDTVVVEVDAKHKASDHDPHRVFYGTLTPALTWGLFGLLLGSDGVVSAIVWMVLGAICGGLYNYYVIRHLSKSELVRIGSHLPADSSALAMFIETSDPQRLLESARGHDASVASLAIIGDDLAGRVIGGETSPSRSVDTPAIDQAAALSMVVLRYAEATTATQMATRMAHTGKNAPPALEVELVTRTDPGGRRHVADPKFGVAATAKSNVISWGGFGLVVGAIAGAANGGGFFGLLEGGVVTAVVWGLFGIAAGALYGLVGGRVVSGRKVRSVGALLAPGTSLVLAWAAGSVGEDELREFRTPDLRALVLGFEAVDAGALLEVALSPEARR